MAVALEAVEGLKDKVRWVGLPRFRSRSHVAHLMQILLTAWIMSKQEGRLGVRLPDDPREAGRGLTALQAKDGH